MNEYEYSEVQIGHKIRDAYMEVYKYKRKDSKKKYKRKIMHSTFFEANHFCDC